MLKENLIAGDYKIYRDNFHGNKNVYYIESRYFGYTNVNCENYYVVVHNNVVTIYFPKWENETIQKFIYSWVLYWLVKSGEDKNYIIEYNNETYVIPNKDEIKHMHKIFDILLDDEFSGYTFGNIEDYYYYEGEFPKSYYDLEEYLFDH